MKVYNKSELVSNKKPDEKPTEKKEKNINLTKYRKGRKRAGSIIKLVLLAVLVIVVIYVWTNADRIFEPLRGIASKIENKTSYDVGFPINLPGSTEYSFRRFGESFSLLTDTYLYTYENTGEQLYALKHGYSNPEQITSGKRILIFDKAAYSFALYSKTSLMYEKTLEEKIIYANIGGANMSAIVTESKRYSNVLYIYDDGGNWKYTKKFADENVMGVTFLDDNEHIIVSTISVDSGELVLNYYKYSTKNTDGYVWKYSYRGNSLPCGLYADSDKVISVCDNVVLSVNCKTGEFNGKYSFTGSLKHFDINENMTVIHYNETSTNKNMLIALGSDAQAQAVTTISANAEKAIADGENVYVLEGTHLKAFDASLSMTEEVTLENSDYTDFVKIGSNAYLLGYDTIDSVSIR